MEKADNVYIAKCKDYKDKKLGEIIENIFAIFPLLINCNENTRVLLKPNLVTKATPEKAITTHFEFVRAVIKALKRRGVKDITIADSCGGAAGSGVMGGIYKASGMATIAKEENVKLYLGTGNIIKKVPNAKLVHEFTFIDAVENADVIINLPKLKTHVMAGLTAGVKNVYGVIPGLLKAELHMRFPTKEVFGDMIVDLNLALGKTVTLIDGITAMQGDGPSGGTPYNAGVVLASENQYLADLVCCTLVDIPPQEVPYLQAAYLRGITTLNYSMEQVLGEKTAVCKLEGFEKPKSFLGYDFGEKYPRALKWATPFVTKLCAPHPVINRNKCIGCGKCAEICPQKVITIKNKKASIKKDKCIKCFCCHEMCPAKAIKVSRFKIFDIKF